METNSVATMKAATKMQSQMPNLSVSNKTKSSVTVALWINSALVSSVTLKILPLALACAHLQATLPYASQLSVVDNGALMQTKFVLM